MIVTITQIPPIIKQTFCRSLLLHPFMGETSETYRKEQEKLVLKIKKYEKRCPNQVKRILLKLDQLEGVYERIEKKERQNKEEGKSPFGLLGYRSRKADVKNRRLSKSIRRK
jgi:hypothetical protein